jgi:hypothetical protein
MPPEISPIATAANVSTAGEPNIVFGAYRYTPEEIAVAQAWR